MLSNIQSLALFASAIAARPSLDMKKHDPSNWSPNDVIRRDVAIIGGGASGTFAAISLKDQHVTTIVIEHKPRMGGHTQTYIDSLTKTPVDYGVAIFHNTSLVNQFFRRFNIPLAPSRVLTSPSAWYDFKTGRQIIPPSVFSQGEVTRGIAKYGEFISQWPELSLGLFVPDPVPAVFSQPLREVAKQHGFEAAIPTLAGLNQGVGDPLTMPFLEFVRTINLSVLQALQTGFIETAARNNGLLYSAAEAELAAAKSVLLSSRVDDAKRTETGVSLIVKTPQGRKLIIATKLLITIPLKLENLKPFDLSEHESTIFGKFMNGAYYAGVLRNSGLPNNLTIVNGDPKAPYNIYPQPGVSLTRYNGPDLALVLYTGPRSEKSEPYSDKFVKNDILASFKKLQQVNPGTFRATEPKFEAFSSFNPFYLQVRGEDIKNGFYKDLYALQGRRSTFLTGASMFASDSSNLWLSTNAVVIPKIIQSLRK